VEIAVVSDHLAPVIAASTRWLVDAFLYVGSPGIAAFAEVQARQAVMVGAWLRYPTPLDAALIELRGPARVERLSTPMVEPAQPWHSWIDEIVVSWAACLLADVTLARDAVQAASGTEHACGLSLSFRSLLEPDPAEIRAAALLRHPDLLSPVADLHRQALVALLAARGDRAGTDPAPSTPSW
jgi:hypothetical protein